MDFNGEFSDPLLPLLPELETHREFSKALVGFRGDGERAHVTSASIKEPSKAFPRLRVL